MHTRDEILAMDAAQLRRAIAEVNGFEYRQTSPNPKKYFCKNVGNNKGWWKLPGRKDWACASCSGESIVPDWPNDIAAAWALAEEAGFVIGPEYSGGFDSIRVGWAVYSDWMVAADDTYSMPGSSKALAVEETAPLAICRAWLMWKEGAK